MNQADNTRRCLLIDREIADTITPAEQRELDELQSRLYAERQAKALLPVEEAKRARESMEMLYWWPR